MSFSRIAPFTFPLSMFFKKKIDLKMINPSSKMSLKMSCIASCQGNIEQAEKLYHFLSDGIESIPDFDIPQPTVIDQLKQGASNVLKFVKDNRQDIMDGINLVRSWKNSQTTTSEDVVTEIPPLPSSES